MGTGLGPATAFLYAGPAGLGAMLILSFSLPRIQIVVALSTRLVGIVFNKLIAHIHP